MSRPMLWTADWRQSLLQYWLQSLTRDKSAAPEQPLDLSVSKKRSRAFPSSGGNGDGASQSKRANVEAGCKKTPLVDQSPGKAERAPKSRVHPEVPTGENETVRIIPLSSASTASNVSKVDSGDGRGDSFHAKPEHAKDPGSPLIISAMDSLELALLNSSSSRTVVTQWAPTTLSPKTSSTSSGAHSMKDREGLVEQKSLSSSLVSHDVCGKLKSKIEAKNRAFLNGGGNNASSTMVNNSAASESHALHQPSPATPGFDSHIEDHVADVKAQRKEPSSPVESNQMDESEGQGNISHRAERCTEEASGSATATAAPKQSHTEMHTNADASSECRVVEHLRQTDDDTGTEIASDNKEPKRGTSVAKTSSPPLVPALPGEQAVQSCPDQASTAEEVGSSEARCPRNSNEEAVTVEKTNDPDRTHAEPPLSSSSDHAVQESNGQDGDSLAVSSPSLSSPEPSTTQTERVPGEVNLTLFGAELWKAFRAVGTEMIINRSGRRMFPIVEVGISGLRSDAMYNVYAELTPVDRCQYKFLKGSWKSLGELDRSVGGPRRTPDPQITGPSVYKHPNSPNQGRFWMEEKNISFGKLKLTNHPENEQGFVLLRSMRKYYITVRVQDVTSLEEHRFPLPETTFVAVTQYQNQQVTDLKVDHNPFANGLKYADSQTRGRRRRRSRRGRGSSPEGSPVRDPGSSPEDGLGVPAGGTADGRHLLIPTSYATIPHQPCVAQATDLAERSRLENVSQLQIHSSPQSQSSSCQNVQDSSAAAQWKDIGHASTVEKGSMALSKPVPWSALGPLSRGEVPLTLAPLPGAVCSTLLPTPPVPIHPVTHPSVPALAVPTHAALGVSVPSKSVASFAVHSAGMSSASPPSASSFGARTDTSVSASCLYSPISGVSSTADAQRCSSLADRVLGWKKQDGIELGIRGLEMWRVFDSVGNEMIINKTGRRMFPFLVVRFKGLNPDAFYSVWLEFSPVDQWTHRYTPSGWVPVEPVQQDVKPRRYRHPDSPHRGAFWCSDDVQFKNFKLTNHPDPSQDRITLQSKRKYYITLVLREEATDGEMIGQEVTFPIPETRFVATTQYQNEKVVDLKIMSNPFASGFRNLVHDGDGTAPLHGVSLTESKCASNELAQRASRLSRPEDGTADRKRGQEGSCSELDSKRLRVEATAAVTADPAVSSPLRADKPVAVKREPSSGDLRNARVSQVQSSTAPLGLEQATPLRRFSFPMTTPTLPLAPPPAHMQDALRLMGLHPAFPYPHTSFPSTTFQPSPGAAMVFSPAQPSLSLQHIARFLPQMTSYPSMVPPGLMAGPSRDWAENQPRTPAHYFPFLPGPLQSLSSLRPLYPCGFPMVRNPTTGAPQCKSISPERSSPKGENKVSNTSPRCDSSLEGQRGNRDETIEKEALVTDDRNTVHEEESHSRSSTQSGHTSGQEMSRDAEGDVSAEGAGDESMASRSEVHSHEAGCPIEDEEDCEDIDVTSIDDEEVPVT